MTRAIIPCAGYGIRMGMSPDKSKELLINPSTGFPIIKYHLNLCEDYGLLPLIVTRKEKTDLLYYADENNVDTLVIEPKGEWPNSVLLSKDKWMETNILLLPDTKFEPHDIIVDMLTDLQLGANISLGVHQVTEPAKWCIIEKGTMFEKPNWIFGPSFAFGIIAFTKFRGNQLFYDLEHKKNHTLVNTSFHYLESFKDLTRTGKIE